MPYRGPHTTPARWLRHAAANVLSDAASFYLSQHPEIFGTDEFHRKWKECEQKTKEIWAIIDSLDYLSTPLPAPPQNTETKP
jgi:hypothetical protein